jgi:hypothetical protein
MAIASQRNNFWNRLSLFATIPGTQQNEIRFPRKTALPAIGRSDAKGIKERAQLPASSTAIGRFDAPRIKERAQLPAFKLH